jgi:outer membrane protein assembly factor BamB
VLSVTSRWKYALPAPATRIALASGDGGGIFADEKGNATLFDVDGKSVWTNAIDDSIRSVRVASAGKGGFVMTVQEVTRFGLSGKAMWRMRTPPFPVDLAVRDDGGAFAVSADGGLLKIYSATAKETAARRYAHSTDYIAFAEDGASILVVSKRGDVSYVDEHGETRWHVAIGCEACHPDVSRDRVVIPSFDGVYAFLSDGTAAGIYDVGAPTVRALFGDGGRALLVQDAKRRLLLLDVATGDTRWHLTLPEDPRDVAFSHDGTGILISSWGGDLERLDVSSVEHGTGTSARAPARPAATPGGAGFLEVEAGPGLAIAPKPRWRVPVQVAGEAEIVVLPKGAGVALLDRSIGSLVFHDTEGKAAWSASRLGSGVRIAAGRDGAPIVAAGDRGVRVFDAARGEIANAPVAARQLAVAIGGGAILVGAANARLHLYGGDGAPVWDVPTPGISSVALSPSGHAILLVRGGDLGLQLRKGGSGFQKKVAPDGAVVQALVREGDVLWISSTGRAGRIAHDGASIFETAVPPLDAIVRAGDEILVHGAIGWSRLEPSTGKTEPLKGAGRASPSASREGGIAFAVSMDRLLGFRYDSKEIACVEAVSGTVLWRRAVGSAPRAIGVSADGTALAGIVSGELVLYDLAPAGSPPAAEAPPRFLEL